MKRDGHKVIGRNGIIRDTLDNNHIVPVREQLTRAPASDGCVRHVEEPATLGLIDLLSRHPIGKLHAPHCAWGAQCVSSTLCLGRRGPCALVPQNPAMIDSVDPKIYQTHLRAWREQRKLTQEQVAEALDVVHTTVGRWERGKMPLDTSQLVALCRLYDVTPQMLLAPPSDAAQADRVAEIGSLVKNMDDEAFRHLVFMAKKLG